MVSNPSLTGLHSSFLYRTPPGQTPSSRTNRSLLLLLHLASCKTRFHALAGPLRCWSPAISILSHLVTTCGCCRPNKRPAPTKPTKVVKYATTTTFVWVLGLERTVVCTVRIPSESRLVSFRPAPVSVFVPVLMALWNLTLWRPTVRFLPQEPTLDCKWFLPWHSQQQPGG